MADHRERDDLLPGNATDLERVFSELDGRLDDIDMALIRRVKSAEDAPAGFLPFLAWERSVDVWDSDWPESIKLRAIAMAPVIHRYKGTVKAVRAALDIFDVRMAITEWWQTSPKGQPYTFHINAFATGRLVPGQPLLTATLQRQILASVIAAKPVSRAFSFAIGAGVSARLGAGSAAQALAILRPTVIASPPPIAFESGLGAATAGQAIQIVLPTAIAAPPPSTLGARCGTSAAGAAAMIVTARGWATPPLKPSSRIACGAAARALGIIRLKMEARVS